jgi:hypothetical protein
MELTQHTIQQITIKAAAETVRSRFIGFDGNHCAAGKKAVGVSEFDGYTNKNMPVHTYGVVIVEAGAAILEAGTPVTSDANGKAVAASELALADGAVGVTADAAAPTLTGSITPEAINGYAVTTAAAAGEFILVKLV